MAADRLLSIVSVIESEFVDDRGGNSRCQARCPAMNVDYARQGLFRTGYYGAWRVSVANKYVEAFSKILIDSCRNVVEVVRIRIGIVEECITCSRLSSPRCRNGATIQVTSRIGARQRCGIQKRLYFRRGPLAECLRRHVFAFERRQEQTQTLIGKEEKG